MFLFLNVVYVFCRVIFCFVSYLCGFFFNFHLFIALYFIFYCLFVITCFCILLCSYFVFISSFIFSIACFDGPKAHIFLGLRRLFFSPTRAQRGPIPQLLFWPNSKPNGRPNSCWMSPSREAQLAASSPQWHDGPAAASARNALPLGPVACCLLSLSWSSSCMVFL